MTSEKIKRIKEDETEIRAGRGQIIVEVDPPEEKTEGGIQLPEGGMETETASGTVIHCHLEGDEEVDAGDEPYRVEEPYVQEGDTVLWHSGMGFYFEQEGIGYCSLYEEEVRAILK